MNVLTTHNHLGDHVCLTAVAHNIYDITHLPVAILHSKYDSLYLDNPYVTIALQGNIIKCVYPGSQRLGDAGNLCLGYTGSALLQLGLLQAVRYTKPLFYMDLTDTPVLDYVCIFAGYMDNCTVKNWSRYNWQQFIYRNPYTYYQMGSHGLHDIQPRLRYVNDLWLGHTDLLNLLSIIKYSKGVIGYCSACMHISAAFDIPAICIRGNRLSLILINYANVKHAGLNLPCGPCMKFYAGQGTTGKQCTNCTIKYNLVIPACMDVTIDKLFRQHINVPGNKQE